MHFYDVGTFHCCVATLEYGAPIMHDACFGFSCPFMIWIHFNVVWPLQSTVHLLCTMHIIMYDAYLGFRRIFMMRAIWRVLKGGGDKDAIEDQL